MVKFSVEMNSINLTRIGLLSDTERENVLVDCFMESTQSNKQVNMLNWCSEYVVHSRLVVCKIKLAVKTDIKF